SICAPTAARWITWTLSNAAPGCSTSNPNTFWTNNFGTSGGDWSWSRFDVDSAIQQNGLSSVIPSWVQNPDGSFTLNMGDTDFNELYGNTQAYFQQCGCQDVSNLLGLWADAIARQQINTMVTV